MSSCCVRSCLRARKSNTTSSVLRGCRWASRWSPRASGAAPTTAISASWMATPRGCVKHGAGRGRTLTALWGWGEPILSVSVVPVALTEYSKHQLVRQPIREECRAALAVVSDFATRAVAERGYPWCFGADELYLRADEPLPPAEWYGDFEQRENGVGAVRYLQMRIAAAQDRLADLRGKRIAIATGPAMGPLMPQVVADLGRATGATFEVLALENPLFGSAVTSAGLLPGAAFLAALGDRRDSDLALLPAEAVNDDLRFLDDLEAHGLAARLPMPIRFSYDFADALEDCGLRNADCGLERPAVESAIRNPQSAMRGGEE